MIYTIENGQNVRVTDAGGNTASCVRLDTEERKVTIHAKHMEGLPIFESEPGTDELVNVKTGEKKDIPSVGLMQIELTAPAGWHYIVDGGPRIPLGD